MNPTHTRTLAPAAAHAHALCTHAAHASTPTNQHAHAPTSGPIAARRPSIVARLLRGLVYLYQITLAPFIGGRCRFYPSCSAYAAEALTTHGALRGSWFAARRLARCHPLGGHGIDLVPPRSDKVE